VMIMQTVAVSNYINVFTDFDLNKAFLAELQTMLINILINWLSINIAHYASFII